ncbi:MAG TPA: ComF family protein [Nitrospiraceae bacterium]|nr:ComF family protein [Nitrospiraceae bacterium]
MPTTPSQFLPAFLRQAMRFLLPVDCATCGSALADDPIPLFCTNCWGAISPLPHSRCARCDRPFASPVATAYSPGHVCQSCAERPPSYTRAWTLYPYLSPLRDAICLLKYRGKVALASPLARLMTDRLPPLDALDLIIPVPLHPQRLREREFNQSLLLADRIARYLNAPVFLDNLSRIIPSPAQTTLSRKDRLKNLRGAFAVRHADSIAGKRILLIDDVFTTGATVNECAKTLRKAGSGDVFVLTLARTMDTSTVPDRILARQTHPVLGLLGG